ncbi:MAG: hypothetical protein Q9217_005325, partial [Psora testacea]
MPLFKRNLAGPGHIILNGIRICNIIALLSVVAASFVMLVKTFTISKFFFFDGVSHLITASISIGLLISESYIFRQKSLDITARMIRAHGVQAPQKVTPYISPSPSTRPSQRRRSFHLRRSNTDVLPSYHTDKTGTRNISEPIGRSAGLGMPSAFPEKRTSSLYEDATNGREGGIHMPPVVNGVPKPDLAHHPYYQGR